MADTSTTTAPTSTTAIPTSATENTLKDDLLRLTNLISYVLFITSSIFTLFRNTIPKWTFIIWIPINNLLFGAVVYQYSPNGKRIILNGLSWGFPFLTILTILCCTWGLISVLFRPLLVMTPLANIYFIAKKPSNSVDNITEWFKVSVKWPISPFVVWSAMLLVYTIFEIIYTLFRYEQDLIQLVVILIFLSLYVFIRRTTNAIYTFCSNGGDLPVAVAIDWALWSIVSYRPYIPRFVYDYALAWAIIDLIWIVKAAKGLSDSFSYYSHGRIVFVAEM